MARIGNRVATILVAVLVVGMLVAVPGVAAADSTTENSADNADDNAGSDQDPNTHNTARENHDGGESPYHIETGFTNACASPADDSPEGQKFCPAFQ